MDNDDMTPQEDKNLSIAGDIVSDLLLETSVPAPIRKGLLRALRRLCSAAVDIPVAHLEGRADERRAETQARIRLVETTADQIAQQMRTDPEYARRAISQFGQKILREQVNLDQIALRSAETIRSDATQDSEGKADEKATIDDDWFNSFDAEARTKSTEEMQVYFSRVLAGEIQRPHSFSIRSLRTLGNLDVRSARLFENFCSMCSSIGSKPFSSDDARVFSLGQNAASNALAEFNFNFNALNVLNEHGLVISDYHSWKDYTSCVSIPVPSRQGLAVQIPFHHQNKWWVLVPEEGYVQKGMLKLHGVALTQAGRELMRIVKMSSTETYTRRLIQYFRSLRLTMRESSDHRPRVIRPRE